MAILSAQQTFSSAQAITATAASTNVIDFGAPGTWVHATTPLVDDKGTSCIPLMVQVTETFNNLTSLTITVQQDNDEAFGSATNVYAETIVAADLVAGAKTAVRVIPYNTDERYMRINYTVTGTAPTTGTVTAGIASVESTFGAR